MPRYFATLTFSEGFVIHVNLRAGNFSKSFVGSKYINAHLSTLTLNLLSLK